MAKFFSGGMIWCGVGSVASSVRIDGAKIVEINGAVHPGDEVIDLQGGFLAPAFMDGHAHPLFAGRESQGPLVNGLLWAYIICYRWDSCINRKQDSATTNKGFYKPTNFCSGS